MEVSYKPYEVMRGFEFPSWFSNMMIIANPDKNYFSMYWEQKKKYDLKVHLKENEKSLGKI